MNALDLFADDPDIHGFPPLSVLYAMSEVVTQLPKVPAKDMHQVLKTIYYNIPDTFLIPDTKQLGQKFEEWKECPRYNGPTVPLYDILTNCGNVILRIQARCAKYVRQLNKNELDYHKVSALEARKKRLPLPNEIDEEPYTLIKAFLWGTPFLELLCTQVPFTIPRKTWASHACILAPSGWGKSQLLGSILREAVEDQDARTVILFDPHAHKHKSVFQLARERIPADRLVVIDPHQQIPDVGLLDFGVLSEHDALETFKFLISSLASGLSAKQETCIPSLFALLSKIPNASLITLHELITEKVERREKPKYAAYIDQLDDVHRDFFYRLFYSGSSYDETKNALQWKLLAAIGNANFKKMFSATRNSINFDRYLDTPKVVLVSGGELVFGKEGMRIFLLFLLGQYYAAAKRRKSKHLAMCLVDEAWMVLQSPLITDILVELRGFNCSLVCCTQIWNQVAEAVRPAILGSTAIKACGAIQHNDASVWSRDMMTTVQHIRHLKPYDGEGSKAQWAFHLTGMQSALTVSVPYGTLERMPTLHDAHLLQETMSEPVTEQHEQVADQAKDAEIASNASEALIKPGKVWD